MAQQWIRDSIASHNFMVHVRDDEKFETVISNVLLVIKVTQYN